MRSPRKNGNPNPPEEKRYEIPRLDDRINVRSEETGAQREPRHLVPRARSRRRFHPAAVGIDIPKANDPGNFEVR